MIARIKGKLVTVEDERALLETGGITYAVMVSRSVAEDLITGGHVGGDVQFFTMYYIEGGVGMSNLVPRLVGFLSETDLAFFTLLTSVPGLSVKRSLRACAIPARDMARIIEASDTTALKKLPEIGAKLAQKIVMELKGKTAAFAWNADERPEETPVYSGPEEDFMAEAVEVLVQLQYDRFEAENLIRKVLAEQPSINTSDLLIQEVFKRQGRG